MLQLHKPINILNIPINLPVMLAPMVGLSHVAFRHLLRDYMPKAATTLWPTEMLNSRRIPSENLAKTPETLRFHRETELWPQILGNEERPIVESVLKLKDWGAEAIDINMGCPVKKALAHNYGVALMGDSDYAARVVSFAANASSLKVSVKLRAGEQNDIKYLLDFVQKLVDAGASCVTLHPRTPEQKRRGRADWNQIKILRESVKIPIIGNGDIQTLDDILLMISQTGCSAVMVGRALTARPWLLWQLGEHLGFEPPEGREGERAPKTEVEEAIECGRAIQAFAGHCEHYFAQGDRPFSADLALRKFRFFVRNMSPWLDFGHDLYAKSMYAKDFPQLRSLLAEFFAKPLSMTPKPNFASSSI
jgi:tRNA-dihydrouridine synthase B